MLSINIPTNYRHYYKYPFLQMSKFRCHFQRTSSLPWEKCTYFWIEESNWWYLRGGIILWAKITWYNFKNEILSSFFSQGKFYTSRPIDNHYPTDDIPSKEPPGDRRRQRECFIHWGSRHLVEHFHERRRLC